MSINRALFSWITTVISICIPLYTSAADIQYTYDNLNRLTKVEYQDGTVVEYSYDAAGNRLTTAVVPNSPPNTPASPAIANGAGNVDVNADLGWTGGDPNAGDTVTYDIYLDTNNTPTTKVASGLTSLSFDPGILTCETTYYWKVVAIDQHGAQTASPVWSFATATCPVAQFSSSPLIGVTPLLVTFTNSSTGASSYLWDFGDGGTSTEQNPVHIYSTPGSFTVSLTATGEGGSDTVTKSGYIKVTAKGDFDADGKSDILLFNATTGQVYTWLMDGTGISGQGSPWTLGPGSPWQIAGRGDFDGDGKSDILLFNSSTGQVYIWLMNGTTISSAGSPWTMGPGSPWQISGVGDFNGDGKSDILLFNSSTGQVYIWLMDGTTISDQGSPWTLGPDSPWQIVGHGDFNGDGKSDILLHDSSTGQVYIWLMDGTTISSHGSPWTLGAGTPWQIAGVGDFDGDGKSDILLNDSSTGQVYIWLMNGTTISGQGSPWTLGAGSPWQIAGAGDFNGDGRSDILLYDSSTGQVYIWLMNGTVISGQGSPWTLGSGSPWRIKN
jgi:YD repeat-containing protein